MLSEKQPIEVLMILSYGDRKRKSKSTASKNGIGNVRAKPKCDRPTVAEELNVLFRIDENLHCSIATFSDSKKINRNAVQNIRKSFCFVKLC